MTNYNAIKGYLEKHYGKSEDYTISVSDGEITITGYMYGNNECFDVDEFYQYVLTTDGKLYKAYYEIPKIDGVDDGMDWIDYDRAYHIREEDLINYSI